jgi:ATP-dependent helicase YprA (DUF1998 family)
MTEQKRPSHHQSTEHHQELSEHQQEPPPLTFVCELPRVTNSAATRDWADPSLQLKHLGPLLERFFSGLPYAFQAEAITEIMNGAPVILTAGTGSGKSEVFLLAAIELLLQQQIDCVLLCYPTKQLVQDQETRLAKYLSLVKQELGKTITYSRYTGDLSTEAVRGVEQACPDILLGTFDKVFYRIIRHYSSQYSESEQAFKTEENLQLEENGQPTDSERFFNQLIGAGLLVFDEVHDYSGLTLSNIYYFVQLHQLRNPHSRVVLSSATLSEPFTFRDSFLPSAKVVTGKPHRGRLQVLATEKKHLEQLISYLQSTVLSSPAVRSESLPTNNNSKENIVSRVTTTRVNSNKSSSTQVKPGRIILFNDNISQNESFTYLVKNQLASSTGLELSTVQAKASEIACIHSQLSPYRKRSIVRRTQNEQISMVVSTAVLAQGVDFPNFFAGIQIGWPINGLVGALQRIGRIRFSDHQLNKIKYFFFIFDPKKEPDSHFLNHPQKLAQQILQTKLPPLIFSPVNFRLAQGLILLGCAYGLNNYQQLLKLLQQQRKTAKANKTALRKFFRQAVTSLISKGIIRIDGQNLIYGESAFLESFFQAYSIRSIPLKWQVKDFQTKEDLFTLTATKVLREALPGNLLLNDGIFWLIETIDQRTKKVLAQRYNSKTTLSLSEKKKNRLQSPRITFGRFAQTLPLAKDYLTITFGEMTIIRQPTHITRFHPIQGFKQVAVDEQFLQESNKNSNYLFKEESAGLELSFEGTKVLARILGVLHYRSSAFLRLLRYVLLAEISQHVIVPTSELSSFICWQKDKESIGVYDRGGVSGYSQKVFQALPELLRSIQVKIEQCSCVNGCGKCYPRLNNYFESNPKYFLGVFLREVLK